MAKRKTTTKRAAKSHGDKKPFDLYQHITDLVLQKLDEGTVPWQSAVIGNELPQSLSTGKPYRGVNIFLLAMTALAKQYDSPWWVTFKQAVEWGGKVKKGEKATRIVFWKKLKPKEDPDDGRRPGELSADDLKPKFILRHFSVFNAKAQCEGLNVPAPIERPAEPFVAIREAERILANYPNPPPIEHGGVSPAYLPKLDVVRMPEKDRYVTAEEYYADSFHEHAHATSHKSRLDRDISTEFGSTPYAKEELIAEMSSAFLCAAAGSHRRRSTARPATWTGGRRSCGVTTSSSSTPPPRPNAWPTTCWA
ncbi:MAG: ArdC-like ssDNA-binding domain-containing protein [Planctomycetota bacterium]